MAIRANCRLAALPATTYVVLGPGPHDVPLCRDAVVRGSGHAPRPCVDLVVAGVRGRGRRDGAGLTLAAALGAAEGTHVRRRRDAVGHTAMVEAGAVRAAVRGVVVDRQLPDGLTGPVDRVVVGDRARTGHRRGGRR